LETARKLKEGDEFATVQVCKADASRSSEAWEVMFMWHQFGKPFVPFKSCD